MDRKRLSLILFLAVGIYLIGPPRVSTQSSQSGVATLTTTADVAGDSAAHQVQTSGTARWVQFICTANNTAIVRVGDSAVSATRGLPIAAGGGLMLPPIPSAPGMKQIDQFYQLSSIYYIVQTGDAVSIAWGR